MLVKKDKKAYEIRKLKEIGVEPKKVKTPYSILQGMRKKNVAKEEKQRAMVL